MSLHTTPRPLHLTPLSHASRIAQLALLVIYAAILCRGIANPWTGLHDWNGAFYSQLARNLLRYPFDMHHGMPVVAVGDALPGDGEWSFYPTHPPGLVWCIAASFRIFGDCEWAARLVPILASLATLALICRAARERFGDAMALAAGGIYVLQPMAGYFGRMPDQEAPCLFLMLAAVLAADRHLYQTNRPLPRLRPGFIWSICILAAIWMDWVAVILAALVSLRAVIARVRGQIATGHCLRIVAAPVIATILLVVYLLRVGFAGRAADLLAVFTARAGVTVGTAGPDLHALTPWINTVDNLTLPVMALAIVGLVISSRRSLKAPSAPPNTSPKIDGLSLLGITGLIWVAVFWRQYLVHQYWLYYLGPSIANLAAAGILTIYHRLAAISAGTAKVVSALIAIGMVAASHFTMNDLHKRVHCPPADITAWQSARKVILTNWGTDRAKLNPPPPVILARNPIHIETRGNYSFRNIVPPQFAYYFDLPFVVESDLDHVAQLLPHAAAFLVPTHYAATHAEEIASKLPGLNHNSYPPWELLWKR